MPHTCPRDGTTLTLTPDVFGPGLPGEVCPRCVGVMAEWTVAQKFYESIGLPLGALQSAVGAAKAKKRAEAPTPCTACNKANLAPFLVKGVELDLCSECGTAWFDRGELSRVTKGKLGAAQAAAGPQAVAGLRVVEDGVFEMLWDCAYCDAKALLAKSVQCCPVCGQKQDATRRYFPEPGQEVAANTTYDGADKSCPACQTPNGAKSNNCRHCGSPLEGASEVHRVADQVKRAPGAEAPKAAAPAAAPPPPAKGKSMFVYAAGAALALMCACCGVFSLWTKESKATVSGHHWTREIEIESMEPRQDKAWCDELPSEAYAVSKAKAKRSTKQIPDGETCGTRNVDRGDGTFKREKECKPKYKEEPVYDDQCSFSIDKWGKSRSVKADGNGLGSTPRWPALSLRGTGNCRGCEREGAHKETYTVELKGAGGEAWTCDYDESKWRSLAVGGTHDVKVRVIGGGVDCSSL